MTRLRKWLNYGNITATIAVFLAMSGIATAVTLAPANSVVSSSIKDGQVKTPDVAAQNVTAAKLAPEAVVPGKIAAGAVRTPKIFDNAISTPKLADEAITTSKLADDAISTAKLADSSIDSAKIANTEIRSADLAITEVHALGTVGPNAAEELRLECPPGYIVLSGGGGFALGAAQTPANLYVTTSVATTADTWLVIVRNQSTTAKPTYGRAWCLER